MNDHFLKLYAEAARDVEDAAEIVRRTPRAGMCTQSLDLADAVSRRTHLAIAIADGMVAHFRIVTPARKSSGVWTWKPKPNGSCGPDQTAGGHTSGGRSPIRDRISSG